MIERSVKSLLSLIVAGLGWIYSGQIGKGVIFIPVNGALTAVLIGWVLLSIVGHALDAYMTAERNDERYSFR